MKPVKPGRGVPIHPSIQPASEQSRSDADICGDLADWPRHAARTPVELRAALRSAPLTPGVYAFFDADNVPIYIGKASLLRRRLGAYARLEHGPRASDLRPVTLLLFQHAATVGWCQTPSALTALSTEGVLIRALRPRLNLSLGDDRGAWWVGFDTSRTSDGGGVGCPRLFMLRARSTPHSTQYPRARYVGPFGDGKALREVLRALRPAVPFITHPGSPPRCGEFELGLCPLDPARPEAEQLELCRTAARRLRSVLRGRSDPLLRQWRAAMREASAAGDYERAASWRDKLALLRSLRTDSKNADSAITESALAQ